jgi:hypothetical protein
LKDEIIKNIDLKNLPRRKKNNNKKNKENLICKYDKGG